jgi:hypothetical protein
MHRAVTDIADNINLGSGISGKLSFNTVPLSYSLFAFLFNDALLDSEDK